MRKTFWLLTVAALCGLSFLALAPPARPVNRKKARLPKPMKAQLLWLIRKPGCPPRR
jgi:hypothetical protein